MPQNACLRMCNRVEEAEPLMQQALAYYTRTWGPENSFCGTAAFELEGSVQERWGHANNMRAKHNVGNA